MGEESGGRERQIKISERSEKKGSEREGRKKWSERYSEGVKKGGKWKKK